MKKIFITAILSLYLIADVEAQNNKPNEKNNFPDVTIFEDAIGHFNDSLALKFKFERYKQTQVKEIAWNLVKYQNKDGGWPKNIDWLAIIEPDSVKNLLSALYKTSTLDNRNTYSQAEYLAQAYLITKEEKFRKSSERAIDFVLNTQKSSGGWRGWDVDAITYNDEVMTGAMKLLLDIKEEKEYFWWINKERKLKAEAALQKAIDITLKCQIVVDGNKTGWGQQHDHNTLQAVKARAYELPGISSLESAAIVKFLMLIKNPSPEIISAINSAVDWMQKSKLYEIRIVADKEDSLKTFYNSRRPDRKLIKDETAPPIWARYYEIETNRPFFCNRDGIKVYSLSEVLPERRRGYAWYGYWPSDVLNLHTKWKKNLK
ncbi:MAG: pectate lyase [Ignavibacteria bacterium]|nr:MAG: pectate lyase [Ignavibacteria bacterium]KAF0161309.1 MAG: Pectate lyase [Ignavibacteria bacterium]